MGLGNIQPAIVERQDGTLMAYMRDNGVEPKRIIEARSTDGGETWTIGTDMAFPNPGASVSACDMGDGRWVLVYNNAERGRHNLAIALSEDEHDRKQRRREQVLRLPDRPARKRREGPPLLFLPRPRRCDHSVQLICH